MKRYEILAPAGNAEALQCAVNNGADSVYLGLDNFNARMKADNFTVANLSHWVDYCHLYGVKVYVTLNISIKQSEVKDAYKMLCDIYNSNADGVIVTDLALLKFAGDNFPPPFEIVASTQLNIHDMDGAMYVKALGATTVVLARETDSATVKQIAEKSGMKVECFIHGALCVCQSGQCLLSSISGGNSGNRGRCAQPCRKFYKCFDDNGKCVNSGYLLSPKDWCGANVAQQMYNDGVSVYKIEGRNRRSSYAGEASRFYSQLFENGFDFSDQQLDQLKTQYNRGDYLYDGYYKRRNDNIIYPKVQGHIGVVVGEYKKGKLYAVRNVSKGDGFKLLRNGYECGSATALESGTVVRLNVKGNVKDGDTVCLTTDNALNESICGTVKRLSATMKVDAKVGQKLTLTACCNGSKSIYVSDYICQEADKIATSESEFGQQLSKTGNLHYTITGIVFDIDSVFVPKSVINNARREVLQLLDNQIVEDYNAKLNRKQFVFDNSVLAETNESNTVKSGLAVTCFDETQFVKAMSDMTIDLVIVKMEKLDNDTCRKFDALATRRWYMDIPSFTDGSYIEKCASGCVNMGLVAHNVGTVQTAKRLNLDCFCHTGLNIYNNYFAQLLTDNYKYPFAYSVELTFREIGDIGQGGYIFADGELTLMKTVHCPYKLCFSAYCSRCQFKPYVYIDELGNRLVFKRRQADICTFELCNGVKLSVVDKQLNPAKYLCDYNAAVIERLKAVNSGQNVPYVQSTAYTKGRLFDKVN